MSVENEVEELAKLFGAECCMNEEKISPCITCLYKAKQVIRFGYRKAVEAKGDRIMSVENIKWPEKITECPHQSVNPKQLCYRCIDINETIDACKKAVASQQSTASEVPSREVPSVEEICNVMIHVKGVAFMKDVDTKIYSQAIHNFLLTGKEG